MANKSTSLGLVSEGGSLFMPGNRTEEYHRKQDVSMPRDRAGSLFL
jgi:hypothetical protein